jgi:histidinol-phosphatase
MNRPDDLSDDLTLALALADAADAITAERFGAVDLLVETKLDMTPVTDADQGVEQMVRDRLQVHRPDDAVFGEEFGGDREVTGRQWVVDPIDGTKNFVRGVPVWATLIALLDDGVPMLGVVSAPALQRRWWAATGRGAFLRVDGGQPRRLRVSTVGELADASLTFSSLSGWADRGTRDRFVELTDAVWRVRAYGDFWNYCLVAEGSVDIAAEPEVSLWDLAALDVLVREAGGAFTDLQGRPGPHGGSAVATNGKLQQAVLDRIASV